MLKKIVIIGPESTGKSFLSEQLAQHYKTVWCPEYAREYLRAHGTEYTYDDLLKIAQGQLALEDQHAQTAADLPSFTIHACPPERRRRLDSRFTTQSQSLSEAGAHHSPFFIDTNMYVMKVWCEFVFKKCHRYILDQIVSRSYDLYLLCNTDLPWVEDELREYPDPVVRHQLYLMYEDIMINQAGPWVDISGNYDQRLETALTAVDKLLNK